MASACSRIARSCNLLVSALNSQKSANGMKIDTMTTAITCRKMIRAKIDLNRIPLHGLGEEIADTAYGMDDDAGAVLGKLLAKAVNIDFDGIGGDLAGESENLVFDQLFRHNAVLAPH